MAKRDNSIIGVDEAHASSASDPDFDPREMLISKGKTVIVATQTPEDIERCDKTIDMFSNTMN